MSGCDGYVSLDDAQRWLEERGMVVSRQRIRRYCQRGRIRCRMMRSHPQSRPSLHVLMDDVHAIDFTTRAVSLKSCRACGLSEGSVAEDGSIVEFGRVDPSHGGMRHTICTTCLTRMTNGHYPHRYIDCSDTRDNATAPVPDGWLTVGAAACKLRVSKRYIREHLEQFDSIDDPQHGLLIAEASTEPPRGWVRVSAAAVMLGITKQALYHTLDHYPCRLFHGVIYLVDPLCDTQPPGLRNHIWLRRQIQEGQSYEAIANQLGDVSAKTVFRAVQQLGMGLAMRSPPTSLDAADARDWVYEMFLVQSRSKAQIAMAMGNGVTIQDVDRALKRWGIKRCRGNHADTSESKGYGKSSSHK